MAQVGEVIFKIKADMEDFSKNVKSGSGDVMKLAKGIGMIGLGVSILKPIGDSILDVGMKSETAFAMTNTLLEGNKKQLQSIKTEAIDLGAKYGQSAEVTADALYNLRSAGVAQNNVMKMYESNVRLATASGAELADVIDITTTATNAYKMNTDETDKAMEQLIQTQNLGKTTVAELAQNMGKLLPITAANSVSFTDTSAAMATMTAQGINTAESTTMLKAAVNEMSKSGTKTAKVLQEKTGKSFKELMEDGNSLSDVLDILGGAADEQGVAMTDLFGSVQAGTAVLALTGDNAETFKNNIVEMGKAEGVVGDAFDKTSNTAEHQSKIIKEKANAQFIKMYDVLNKMLGPALKWIADNMDWLAPIILTVAIAIGVFATALGIVTVAQWLWNSALLANPAVWIFLGIVAAIGTVIAIFFVLKNNWDKIAKFFNESINNIKNWFVGLGNGIKGAFNNSLNWVKTKFDWLKAMINLFIAMARMQFNKVKNIIMTPFRIGIDWVKNKFDWLKKSIGNVIGGIGGFISNMFTNAINNIKRMINSFMISPLNGAVGVINKIPGVNIPKIPMLAKGGIVDKATLAVIGEAGSEAVVPMENDRVMSTLANKILSKGAGIAPNNNNNNSISNNSNTIIENLVIQARDYADVEKGLLKLAKGSGY